MASGSKSDRHDRVFASLLNNHGGWALWNKFSSVDLAPGNFGYFDADGDWKEIVHLLEPGEFQLQRDKWGRLEKHVEVKTNTGTISWGPKASASVGNWDVGGKLGGPVQPGVELAAEFKLQAGSEIGAVLVTTSPIVQTTTSDNQPLLKWVRDNSPAILERYRSLVKDHGLWIITQTYQTSRCALSILRSKSSEAKIGLTVDVSGVASLSPNASWSSASRDCASVIYEDKDDGVIVMFSGIYIKKGIFRDHVKAEPRPESQQLFRGHDEDAAAPSEEAEPLYLIDPVVDDEQIGMYVKNVKTIQQLPKKI